jgi:hypothetical protein
VLQNTAAFQIKALFSNPVTHTMKPQMLGIFYDWTLKKTKLKVKLKKCDTQPACSAVLACKIRMTLNAEARFYNMGSHLGVLWNLGMSTLFCILPTYKNKQIAFTHRGQFHPDPASVRGKISILRGHINALQQPRTL